MFHSETVSTETVCTVVAPQWEFLHIGGYTVILSVQRWFHSGTVCTLVAWQREFLQISGYTAGCIEQCFFYFSWAHAWAQLVTWFMFQLELSRAQKSNFLLSPIQAQLGYRTQPCSYFKLFTKPGQLELFRGLANLLHFVIGKSDKDIWALVKVGKTCWYWGNIFYKVKFYPNRSNPVKLNMFTFP